MHFANEELVLESALKVYWFVGLAKVSRPLVDIRTVAAAGFGLEESVLAANPRLV